MGTNTVAKQFEVKFREDWKKSFPDSFCYRLPDQMTGYKTVSQNPCDIVCYSYPNLYLVECKTHKGNTFPFDAFRQYSNLLQYAGIKGLRAGIVLWFLEHDEIVYVPVKTVEQMIKDGKKSINIKDISNNVYRIIKIPSVKKKVYFDSDYSIFQSLNEGD